MINVGDKWTPQSNFDKATDKDGKAVSFSSIEIDKKELDTNQVKEVKISYSYGGITRYAIVSIRDAGKGSDNSSVDNPKAPGTGNNDIQNLSKNEGFVSKTENDKNTKYKHNDKKICNAICI